MNEASREQEDLSVEERVQRFMERNYLPEDYKPMTWWGDALRFAYRCVIVVTSIVVVVQVCAVLLGMSMTLLVDELVPTINYDPKIEVKLDATEIFDELGKVRIKDGMVRSLPNPAGYYMPGQFESDCEEVCTDRRPSIYSSTGRVLFVDAGKMECVCLRKGAYFESDRIAHYVGWILVGGH